MGRREIVRTLEHIAIWEHLFVDVANLLLRLGEAENETWSNNASGVFADLFSLGYGPVAATSAPPSARFPVLRQVLLTGSKEQQLLAIKAVDHALESRHLSRAITSQHQSLKRGPELWTPGTYGELWSSYQEAWQLLIEHMAQLSPDLQTEASEILLKRAGEISQIPGLAEKVIETLTVIAQNSWVSREEILRTLIRI